MLKGWSPEQQADVAEVLDRLARALLDDAGDRTLGCGRVPIALVAHVPARLVARSAAMRDESCVADLDPAHP